MFRSSSNNLNLTIALITDFGAQDYFVGAMKGVILAINPNAKIVDITHEIPPQNIRAAGFNLRACYGDFPLKTIFVAVVDPGVGSHRKAILVETENYYFVAPDNGLLSFVFNEENDFRAFELTNEKFFKNPISNTFHGRDVFAPVAAHLSNGEKAFDFGAETTDFVRFEESKLNKISAHETVGEIIHADRFGNLITNFKSENLPKDFTLSINGKTVSRMRRFFAESEKDELFMIVGSAGFLEIAAFQSSAANLLNAAVGETVILKEII
jgi:S-adenosylmethionine hydrolase